MRENASPAQSRPTGEQCVAASHERERLAQFAKFCPGDCDRSAVLREANDRVRKLLPDDTPQRQPQRGPGRPR